MCDDASNVILDITDSLPIKKNADFVALSGNDMKEVSVGGADDLWIVDIDLSDAGDEMLLTSGQMFQLIRRDNLVAVTEMVATLHGHFLDG